MFLPVAFAVAPKSSAMRAGLVIAKPIGARLGTSRMVTLMTTLLPCWLAVIDSIALPWARTAPAHVNSASAVAARASQAGMAKRI